MITEAREEARRLGRTNARWVNARAEQLPLDLGVFRTATFAQSFHWMERERVAATVFEMLEPNGAWVHVDVKTLGVPATDERLSHPEPPRQEIGELVASYLGPVKRAGQGTLPGGTPSGESDIMVAAGFAGPRLRMFDTKRVLERRRTRSSPRCSPRRHRRRISLAPASASSSRSCEPCSGAHRRTGGSTRSHRPAS